MLKSEVAYILCQNDLYKFTTRFASWLDGGKLLYYRPVDFMEWSKGDWLDKGFNVKFSYKPKNIRMPTIAFGLDDFAWTSYLSRDYIISTFSTDSLKISTGLGWGKYASGSNTFKNPLSYLNSSFENRKRSYGSGDTIYGGQLTYATWFNGPVSLLGGIEWSIPYAHGLKFKIEHDPFDYNNFTANFRRDRIESIREKDSDINFGFSYKVNDYLSLDVSYIKGNTLNVQFAIGAKTNKPKKKIIKQPEVQKLDENSFYDDLLQNMNRNQSFLQTANYSEKNLDIAIMSEQFKNPIRTSLYAANIARSVLENNNLKTERINITTINAGIG